MKPYKVVKVEGIDSRKEQDAFKRKYVAQHKAILKKKFAGIDFEFY